MRKEIKIGMIFLYIIILGILVPLGIYAYFTTENPGIVLFLSGVFSMFSMHSMVRSYPEDLWKLFEKDNGFVTMSSLSFFTVILGIIWTLAASPLTHKALVLFISALFFLAQRYRYNYSERKEKNG